MLFQTSGRARWFIALITFMRYLPTMNEYVEFQISRQAKWFITLSTLMGGPLFTVRHHMLRQLAGTWKWLETHDARMSVDHADRTCLLQLLTINEEELKIFCPHKWQHVAPTYGRFSFHINITLWTRTEVNISSSPGMRIPGLFFSSCAEIFKLGCFVQKYST